MTTKIIVAIIISLFITKTGETKMDFTLPGGFSPVNAIKQVGSFVNPTGGVANYDVFSKLGTQVDMTPHNQGQINGTTVLGSAQDNSGLGALYFDPTLGKFVSTNPSQDPTYNPNPGKSTFDSSGNRVAPVDPYAQWGGQTAYNNLVSGFNTQKQGILDSSAQAGDQTAGKYQRSILDFLDSNKLGQQNIDQKASNNELAKMQGVQGVMGMVGRGIRSGGVTLNNKNSADSSAAERIANAYGEIGRGELANVGNQYEMGNQEVLTDQNAFNIQQASGLRNLQGSKEDSVNMIVNDAGQQLALLDAKMAEASIPQRIAIEQEKANIKAQAIAKLQVFDQQLTSGVQSIAPQDADARRMKAAEMQRAGTNLGQNAFQFSTEAPSTFQGNSPSGGQLPIFTMPRGRREG